MTLCKCGCGEEIVIKPWHKRTGTPIFIKGHSSRMPGHFMPVHNVKHSEESKRKMSENHKPNDGANHPLFGKHHSDKTKKKISESRIGRFKGEENPFYGRHHTDENKRIQSEQRREQYSNGKNPFQGKKHNPSTIETIREKAVLRNSDPEYRKMISENTKKAMTDDICKHLKKINKERCGTPEYRKMKSDMELNRWKTDKVFAERMRTSRNAKPNKSEKFLGEFLDKIYPGEWKFTGDFSFIINGKNPDFVNCNGKKLIIELFGEPWHKGETQEDRAKHFTPFGYKTLVVWWKELKNLVILKQKIEGFVNESCV